MTKTLFSEENLNRIATRRRSRFARTVAAATSFEWALASKAALKAAASSASTLRLARVDIIARWRRTAVCASKIELRFLLKVRSDDKDRIQDCNLTEDIRADV